MIITELSHSAEHLPVLENETVVDIKSGDFISAVLTESGRLHIIIFLLDQVDLYHLFLLNQVDFISYVLTASGRLYIICSY